MLRPTTIVHFAAWGAIALLLAFFAGCLFVHHATSPPRPAVAALDLESMGIHVRELEFQAVDGVRLAGWLVPGRRGTPIVLCHDLGESKESMINLALTLNARGFPVLLFDFRGHGASERARSTLGINEARDVRGAVDWLARAPALQAKRVGVYGVGMGAHAAVLAAGDRRVLRVLVLDGLYPDAGFPLVRRVYSDWGWGVRNLGAPPRFLFGALNRTRIERHRAADVLRRLDGRDILLLAPAGNSALATEIENMYASFPVGADGEGNLVLLPATQSEGLYGEELDRHHERVAEFFASRLP